MAFMQSMINPMRAMGSTPGKTVGGAMGARPTSGQGSMVKNAMNPMQQMRGLGPSSAVPQQKFSGMRGPSRQREQMPMNQAMGQAQPMIQAPQMEQGPEDLGSRDPSQQQYMPQPYGQSGATDQGPYAQTVPYGQKFPGMQRPNPMERNADNATFGPQPQMGLGPRMPMYGNRGMGGDRAGYMGDLDRMMRPYGQ